MKKAKHQLTSDDIIRLFLASDGKGLEAQVVQFARKVIKAHDALAPNKAEALVQRIQEEIDNAKSDGSGLPADRLKLLGEPAVRVSYIEATIEGWRRECAEGEGK